MSTGSVDYEKALKKHSEIGSDLQRSFRRVGDPVDENLIKNIDQYVILSAELIENLQRELAMAEASLELYKKHP